MRLERCIPDVLIELFRGLLFAAEVESREW